MLASCMIWSAVTLRDCRIFIMGMVKIDSPTEISIPSTIAMVRGIFSVVFMPLPGSLEMLTTPPTFSTFFFTTSMPTPLPEYSVTSVLVEKPGIISRFRIS